MKFSEMQYARPDLDQTLSALSWLRQQIETADKMCIRDSARRARSLCAGCLIARPCPRTSGRRKPGCKRPSRPMCAPAEKSVRPGAG